MLSKTELYKYIKEDKILACMEDELMKCPHEIRINKHNQLEWKEIHCDYDTINNDVRKMMLAGINKNDEIYRDYYRKLGYTLYGYWEIFYWEVNNSNCINYDYNKSIKGNKMLSKKEVLKGEVYLITHDNCMDGTCTAMLLNNYCKDNNIKLNIIYLQYGNSSNSFDVNMLNNKNVIMCDFSFDRNKIISIKNITKNLIVLDHHKSAEENLTGLDYCIFDMKKSGATLMWEYLYGDIIQPMFVKYVEDRDIWKGEFSDTEAFSLGIRMYEREALLNKGYDAFKDNFVNDVIKTGNVLLKDRDMFIKKIVDKKKSLPRKTIDGHNVICINNNTHISNVGNELSDNEPFVAQYFITDKDIVFSLRSLEDGEDVSVIARSYGGGGHPRAAGFSFPLENFNFIDFFKLDIV